MAYNIFPKNDKDIQDFTKDAATQKSLSALLSFLQKKFPKIIDPIALDRTQPKIAKVTRALQTEVTLAELKRISESKINVKFGSGSRGGRGSNNKGNAYESIFADEIRKWWQGDPVNSVTEKVLDELYNLYDLDKIYNSDLRINLVGELNNKRPLNTTGNIEIGQGFKDVGKTLSDITLTDGRNDIVHLSLKTGNTTTFFNVGVARILPRNELETGQITNQAGVKLLELFGLDNHRVCKIFNKDQSVAGKEDSIQTVNKQKLEHFIKSGIGYGYHMIHKKSSGIISKKIDKAYAEKASRVQSVEIFYGGKGGSGTRIDIIVETPVYTFNFNIRDSSGNKNGYPSHIFGEYKYK